VFDEQVKCYWKLFHMERTVRKRQELVEEKKSRNRGGMNGSSMDGDPTDKRIGRWDEIINGENERCRSIAEWGGGTSRWGAWGSGSSGLERI
jgi:hypothetical protein